MTTFDEREHAFEEKFAHDQEIRFRVRAVRNRLLGFWVAEKLRFRPAEAEAYATALAQAGVAKFQDDDIVRRVVGDLLAQGEPTTEAEIRRQLERLLPIAKTRVAEKL
jgi:hypothetical protein